VRVHRDEPAILRALSEALRRLLGTDNLEVLVDEDVVRPANSDEVDVVLAVAQLHHTVDDAARKTEPDGEGHCVDDASHDGRRV